MKQARRAPRHVTPAAPEPRLSDRPFLPKAAAIFALALAVRLLHAWLLRDTPFSEVLLGDAHGYDEWARRLAAGDWIGTEVFYQAPLYPYFLGVLYATVGSSVLTVRLAQAVLGGLSCAFVAFAGRRFFGDRAGQAAGVMLALYAPAIFFDGLLQKPVLDLCSFTLSLWMVGRLEPSPLRGFGAAGAAAPAYRRIDWLLLGLAMGALSLTRENALVFIAVILGWALLTRRGEAAPVPLGRRAGFVATFIAGLAIVLLPVAIRNYAVGGGFYLTTSQFGPNFFIGNNPKANGTYMSLRFGRGAPEYERLDATELAEHARGRSLTPAEVSAYWTGLALDFITTQPGAWLRLTGRKLLLLVNGTEMLDTESQESYAEYSWPLRVLGPFGHFGVLAPLALLGAILAWPDRRRLGVLYAMTLVYSGSVLMFYVFARYRIPLVPLFMLFAAHALAEAWRYVQERFFATTPSEMSESSASSVSSVVESFGPASLAFAAVALIGLTVAANWPVLSARLMMAITETNLGTAYQAAGKSDQAIAHLRRAAELQPDYAPSYNNLGVTLRAAGRTDEAIAAYRQALALTADYPDAHYNLANALLAVNRAGEATEHFTIALRSIPDSAGVRNNLGIALAAQGQNDAALSAFRAAVAAEPASAVAHRNLGDALSSAGQVDEAVRELSKAIELDPRDPVAHYNLGVVFLVAGQPAQAVTALTTAVQLNPRSAEAHNNLGIAFGSLGRLDQAIAEFRKALAINPRFEDSQRNLQMALQAQAGR